MIWQRERRHVWVLWLGLCAWVMATCGPGSSTGVDGGEDEGDFTPGQCQIDNSVPNDDTDAAWKLEAAGEAQKGFICPKGDIDHFWFQIDTPRTIVGVKLRNSVPLSAVDLCYSIFPKSQPTQKVGELCDTDGTNGVTDLYGTHYLEQAGVYFLQVRDASSDDQDPRNAYLVSIETVTDQDPYEPNNKPEEAKAVGSQKGYISFLGDQDWFKIDGVQAGQVLVVELNTSKANPVDLAYTLYKPDKATPVNSWNDFSGMDGPVAWKDALPLGEAGTYYLKVSDQGDDDSDLEVGYSLAVNVRQNPDSRDQGGSNNDSWDKATSINSGQTIGDAYFPTRGDHDWYKIQSLGTSDTNPALLEVEFSMNSQSQVDPAIDLIVADPRTSCSPGDACEVLSWTCPSSEDCLTTQCRDAQCPSHQCRVEINGGTCAAAGMCLAMPGGKYGCGIRNLFIHGQDWSDTGELHSLHTVAPMYGETYYLLVRDFQEDAFDLDHAYNLKVTVLEEKDTYEPRNGLYLPYLTGEQEDDTRDWNMDLAKPITCTGTNPIDCVMVGYLSFRGDQDWFQFDIPKVAGTGSDEFVDWDINFIWDFQSTKDMKIGFVSPYGQQMGFDTDPGSGTWGTGGDECSYICGEYHDHHMFIWIYSPGFKNYDYSVPYHLTIRATQGCPLNCSYCEPGQTDYPCPH